MRKSYFGLVTLLSWLCCSCAMIKGAPEINPFTEQCIHCHGEQLQGNRNVVLKCGSCHGLTPVSPDQLTSQKIKDAVINEPHIHKAKNLRAGTPSCFNCHRRGLF